MKSSNTLLLAIPVLFLLIYFQVLTTDYAYLDEIYQLWHNKDNSNFTGIHSQGRWITALLFQKLFASVSTIHQIQLLRLFSLAGWITTAVVWAVVYKRWVTWLNLPTQAWVLGSLYLVCSLSVCIYVGWASCMEVFLSTLAGLISGHILYKRLIGQPTRTGPANAILLVSLVLGIASLFTYQSAFGIFLMPFFLHYVHRKILKPDRIVIIGIGFYLGVYIVYYFLFKYSLSVYGLSASDRTELHFDFFKKLSFFFSGPFPQGFSMNFLFLARSVLSQIFYVVVFVVWVIIIFRRNRQSGFIHNAFFIGVTLFLLALIYLPSMIAAENFPSYRTLVAFNLAVFIMVTDSLLYVFAKAPARRIFSWVMALWLVATATYAFNFQFINPLRKEYRVLRNFFETHYTTHVKQVYFVRADKFLFSPEFHTRVYRDEFGAPSTYRDWVPEPIVKQMIFEITKDRSMAEQVNVVQFESPDSFARAKPIIDSTALVVNMNELFMRSK